MTDWAAIVIPSGITVIAGGVAFIWRYASKVNAGVGTLKERLAIIDVKVETLWMFLLRRAQAEALNAGIATMNSPLQVTEKGLSILEPLRVELQEFYSTLPKPISDSMLMWELEVKFSSRLATEICARYKINLGSCLIAAAAVAKNDPTIEIEDIMVDTDGAVTAPATPPVPLIVKTTLVVK